VNTVLLAIIAFGSIYSVIRHVFEEVEYRLWRKKQQEKFRKDQEEWNSLV
jgi:hypothetical protein